MTIAGRSGERRDDDVWPERAHHRHDIVQNGILGPVRSRLIGRLRESEVVLTSEVLMRAVDPSRGEKLLGSDDAKRFAQLVSNKILTTVAPCQGHVGSLDALTSREPGNQLRVLIIWMSGDPQHAHPFRLAHRRAPGCDDIESRL